MACAARHVPVQHPQLLSSFVHHQYRIPHRDYERPFPFFFMLIFKRQVDVRESAELFLYLF
jgi:hypothetical protein